MEFAAQEIASRIGDVCIFSRQKQYDGKVVEKGAALKIARLLTSLPHVVHVEVYGSIARGESSGSDVNLIMVVDDYRMYQNFVQEVLSAILDDSRKSPAHGTCYRRSAFIRVFGRMQATNFMMHAFKHVKDLDRVDLHVLPIYWENSIDDLSRDLPYGDPAFLDNVKNGERIIVCRDVST